ncbi:MAG: hypothetical protein C4519_11100 [Desulfobacteraceae bacterium]|nr:MAG: hypothetical protein C4519_11100 [Desulfobacteraceae bacterium]
MAELRFFTDRMNAVEIERALNREIKGAAGPLSIYFRNPLKKNSIQGTFFQLHRCADDPAAIRFTVTV